MVQEFIKTIQAMHLRTLSHHSVSLQLYVAILYSMLSTAVTYIRQYMRVHQSKELFFITKKVNFSKHP